MKRLLEYVGFNPERLYVKWISGSEGQKFADTATEIVENIKKLGPNKKMRDMQ
ncbi:Methyl-viologen-reducing hydrogenase, delta subunit [Selenihalanaerobacter shriftii]|uniref:Methyl-viologen-reducing hydrogenase, delta subunit n=3 Tax=Selenihalanaerobacter shriftii TaxID=142842 RepID=A0A1T4MJZ2_9FIRM|nr:Methyl-viologen-reducing hydrogenase, delta subunit [Selenihalanaerobacter shriftii]